jgi:phosphatidylglycerol:prolipoprotein diacylglycerol transferase
VVPFFAPEPIRIGSIVLDWWLLLVVTGIAAGTEFGRARAIRQGLSVKVTVDCTLAMVGSGFLVAHFVQVLFYNYPKFQEDWKIILPWYGGYSSIGGFLGAAIAIPLFLHVWKKVPVWAYTDNLAISFMLGWGFGRTGCFTAHDHIGRATDFFLAVSFPADWPRKGMDLGMRHEMGFYEALLSFAMFGLFLLLDRVKPWFHGFFSALTLMIYAPIRIGMDFLRATDLEKAADRHSDPRYGGLTAAQWGCIALFLYGAYVFASRRNSGRMDTSGEILRDWPPGKAPPEIGAQVEAARADAGGGASGAATGAAAAPEAPAEPGGGGP